MCAVYIEIFVVDLISLFLQVHAPSMKLKKFIKQIITPGPYQLQATSSQKPLYNNAVVGTSMMIGRATAVLLHAYQLQVHTKQNSVGLAICEIKTLRKFLFLVVYLVPIREYCPYENLNIIIQYVVWKQHTALKALKLLLF